MSARRFATQKPTKPGIHWRRIMVAIFNHSILIFFTVIIVYPVLWMILASFKTPGELISNIWGLPADPAYQNYADAWEKARLGRALLNSGIVSIGAVLVVVCLSSIAGYAFAKFSFRFSTVILLVMIFTMQAPVPIIPFYVLFVRLKLTDSYLGLILAIASGTIPLAIFIFQAFFRSIPSELREAAKIDGCSEFSAFLRVVMPISGPAVATVSILTFVGAWNEYFMPLLLIRSDELRPLTLTIQVFFLQFGRAEWNVIFATLSIATIPIIVVYVFLQRWFIQGLTSGSIKG